MPQTLCILGRQPHLGLAELESLYGAETLRPVGTTAALLAIEPQAINFARLGGTVKFCKVLTILPTIEWTAIQTFLETAVPEHLTYLPEGKMKLGLSSYGLEVSVKRMLATGLELKKIIKATGRSIRLIPNKEKALNSAQVLHNQLTGALGWELVFVKDGSQTIIAQNIAEQDIEAYAARDQVRPKRDARVGMLPPKLAQIIVNLASGRTPPDFGAVVVDPFCGTGVVLQEATLMGFDVYGSDIDERMTSYADENLQWLAQNYQLRVCDPDDNPKVQPSTVGSRYFKLEVADATSHTWSPPPNFMACETYLGRPFSTMPRPQVLEEVMSDVNTIHYKFLKNLARQTRAGFRACIAVPAWKTRNGFKHLKVLDSLEEIGYTRQVFQYAEQRDLVYHRENQVVGRELVVLTRN